MQSEKIAEGKQLARDMCHEMMIPYEIMMGESRGSIDVADARSVVMAALRFGKGYGSTLIGKVMNRHHSTMYNSVIVYKDVLRKDYEEVVMKHLSVEERETYYKNLPGV